MATEKTIKIQKNKILTYSVNKEGFKTVYGSVLVNENQNINIELKNLNSQDEPFQLGDRLFGISTFVDYFTPSGTYDVDSLKYVSGKQTTGSGLTNIAVIKETWLAKVETELGIETPKGTSNEFVFTYNGSNWDITGALTLAGQSLEDFGISFIGTATEGDVITVVETQYNKFAFFVLDANCRSNKTFYINLPSNLYPISYNYNAVMNCLESGTYYFEYFINNYSISNSQAFNYCKNLGNFILPNGIKINAIIPNSIELKNIWDNRVTLDNLDPIIQSGSTSFNLTNWNFNDNYAFCCTYAGYKFDYNYANALNLNGSWKEDFAIGAPGNSNFGCIPIFEVPVM